MIMCSVIDCSKHEMLTYDDTMSMSMTSDPFISTRRTIGKYLWASTENSYIQIPTKIGSKMLSSIYIYLKIVDGSYVLKVNDSCEVHQNVAYPSPYPNPNFVCKINDLYIRFDDHFPDQFPSIRMTFRNEKTI